jgi:hypothetical protein
MPVRCNGKKNHNNYNSHACCTITKNDVFQCDLCNLLFVANCHYYMNVNEAITINTKAHAYFE